MAWTGKTLLAVFFWAPKDVKAQERPLQEKVFSVLGFSKEEACTLLLTMSMWRSPATSFTAP